jgi:N-formylglutamate deformylase
MQTQIYEFKEGNKPILLSMPHVGTQLQDDVLQYLTEDAKKLPDTDWHLDRLYDFADELGLHIIKPNYSRYVVDLNRYLDGAALYPSANNTELCPLTTFDFLPIYRKGFHLTDEEIQQRINNYWLPYHTKIQQMLGKLKQRYGIAVLFDAHSIRSQVPRFFTGTLPELNIGTYDGKSCAGELAQTVYRTLSQQAAHAVVLNERFKGGYITRAYGNPADNIHSIQLEISQKIYMQETFPYNYEEGKAASVKNLLRTVMRHIMDWVDKNADSQ